MWRQSVSLLSVTKHSSLFFVKNKTSLSCFYANTRRKFLKVYNCTMYRLTKILNFCQLLRWKIYAKFQSQFSFFQSSILLMIFNSLCLGISVFLGADLEKNLCHLKNVHIWNLMDVLKNLSVFQHILKRYIRSQNTF